MKNTTSEHPTPKRRILLVTAVFALLCALVGCKFLSMEPLSVTRVSPEAGVVDTDRLKKIDVFFSADADRMRTEGAFSLLADGIAMEGVFAWPSSDHFAFTPYAAFTRSKSYRIKVTTQAEDSDGNSLKEDFIRDFRASSDSTRPILVAAIPAPETAVASLRPEIALTFSEPMDVTSVINALSLSPDASGYVVDSGDATTFRYALTEDLKWQTHYELAISETARDQAGNSLGKAERRTFFTGIESVCPSVLSVTDVDSSFGIPADSLDDGIETVTDGVNGKDRLRVQFSEPMDRASAERAIAFQPSARYETQWNALDDAIDIIPDGGYEYGALIALTVDQSALDRSGNALTAASLHKFRVTGTRSKPPKVITAYFLNGFDGSGVPLASGLMKLEPMGTFAFADAYSTRPTDSGTVAGFFDVYVDLADGSKLDLTDFLECFSVSITNASVTPFACQIDGDITFMADRVPVNGGNPLPTNRHVARYCVYVNNWDASAAHIPGLMTLSLDAKFEDSLGNALKATWALTACTTD
jgi:hypothetical protein